METKCMQAMFPMYYNTTHWWKQAVLKKWMMKCFDVHIFYVNNTAKCIILHLVGPNCYVQNFYIFMIVVHLYLFLRTSFFSLFGPQAPHMYFMFFLFTFSYIFTGNNGSFSSLPLSLHCGVFLDLLKCQIQVFILV